MPAEEYLDLVNEHLSRRTLLKMGGLAGLAFYIRRGRHDGASAAAVTRAFVVVGAAAHVALAGLAVVALSVAPREEIPVAGALSDMVVGVVGEWSKISSMAKTG